MSDARMEPETQPADRLIGHITHTELVSTDPKATRDWCARVLGWEFRAPMETPDGDYELFHYSSRAGGGIMRAPDPAAAGSVPYVEVADLDDAFAAALRAGAEVVQEPLRVTPDTRVAIVRAPGGVAIGLSGS